MFLIPVRLAELLHNGLSRQDRPPPPTVSLAQLSAQLSTTHHTTTITTRRPDLSPQLPCNHITSYTPATPLHAAGHGRREDHLLEGGQPSLSPRQICLPPQPRVAPLLLGHCAPKAPPRGALHFGSRSQVSRCCCQLPASCCFDTDSVVGATLLAGLAVLPLPPPLAPRTVDSTPVEASICAWRKRHGGSMVAVWWPFGSWLIGCCCCTGASVWRVRVAAGKSNFMESFQKCKIEFSMSGSSEQIVEARVGEKKEKNGRSYNILACCGDSGIGSTVG